MADDADRAAAAEEAAMARLEAELREHRIAQARPVFDASAPRPCHGCGDTIDPARVRLLPATGLCVVCARAAEAQLREESTWI